MNRLLSVLVVLLSLSCSTIKKNEVQVMEGVDVIRIENPEIIDNSKVELPEIPQAASTDTKDEAPAVFTLDCLRPAVDSFTVTDFPSLPEKNFPDIPAPFPWAALEERALYQESIKLRSHEKNLRETPVAAESVKGAEVKHTSQTEKPVNAPDMHTAVPSVESVHEVPEQTVTAVAGEKTALTLSGAGWLFMGQSGKGDGTISFLSRLSRQQDTVFYFTAQTAGFIVLQFERQDPLSGDMFSKKVNFRVVETADEIPDKRTEQDPVTVSMTEKVPELETLLDNEEFDLAFKIYTYPEVMRELLETGVKRGDAARLSIFQDKMSADPEKSFGFITGGETGDLVVDAGKILIRNNFAIQGRSLLESVLEKRKKINGEDEILYILGYVYQNDDQIRDERKAYYYYKKLIDEFPASIYWDSAKREYLFIKRMYIDVR